VVLGSTQPLKEMTTRDIPWGEVGKGDWCLGLTILPLSSADCLQILETHLPGTLWICNRPLRGYFIRLVKGDELVIFVLHDVKIPVILAPGNMRQ
jgi:hypothetical protein